MLKSLVVPIAAIAIAGCGRAKLDVHIKEVGPSDSATASSLPTSPLTADVVPIGQPSQDNVVVVAAAVFPSQAGPGDVVTLAVRFRTAAGWHFFAVGTDDQSEPVLPTTLELDLPPGVSADGQWELPPTDIYDGPTGRAAGYADDVTFRRRLRIDQSQSPGVLRLPLTVSYQACDDGVCTRPAPAELRPTLDVIER